MSATIPLTTKTTTDEADVVASLRLIADSVAQQRQVAARRILTHPLYLTTISFALYLIYRLVYRTSDDRGTLLTTWSGCLMASLLVVQYMTARYIDAAERTGTLRWLFQDDPDFDNDNNSNNNIIYDLSTLNDRILVTAFGDEIIGTLILRPIPRAQPPTNPGENSGRGGDSHQGYPGTVGTVRAWTVRRKYRGLGVGHHLWDEAGEICRREEWDGPVMSRWHANSAANLGRR